MSLVTACVRPSGASYRDDLLARKVHHNPSTMIDDLLKNNAGYLIFQEDIIAFLQQICGLSGSEADTVRRGIARKKPEVLAASMPKIIEGYCSRSDQPREKAMGELNEFLRIIEDASSYMFGYNHSIAYCLLGYLCAYYRFYHPAEFITAFLNNAANDEDIQNGTATARLYGVSVTSPKFGVSGAEYTCSSDGKTIAKGVASVKFMSAKSADVLYRLGQNRYVFFTDLLADISAVGGVDARQLGILLHIDFFSDFGNQRELERIVGIFDLFKQGTAKKISKEKVSGSFVEQELQPYCTGTTKDGKDAASYTILDMPSALHACERRIRSMHLPDIDVIAKVKAFQEAMGYVGYVSGREEDRPLLYVKELYPLKRKKDGKQFGYSLITQSVGSGIETRWTVFNRVFDQEPVTAGDVITCRSYARDGIYFTMTSYRKHYPEEET